MRYVITPLPALLIAAFAASSLAQAPPQPTEQHRELAKEAGVWDADVQMWMSPDAPPVKSTGTETCTMLGPFWLLSDFEGDFGGMQFTGKGQTTYDTFAGEWVSTWIDTMSPILMTTRGTWDDATKTATYLGEGPDWMTGETKKVKMTLTYEDDDHKSFAMYEKPVDAQEWTKIMAIDYTRRD